MDLDDLIDLIVGSGCVDLEERAAVTGGQWLQQQYPAPDIFAICGARLVFSGVRCIVRLA